MSIGQRGHTLLVLTCELCCQLINLPLDVCTSALAFSQPQFTAPLKRMGELSKRLLRHDSVPFWDCLKVR